VPVTKILCGARETAISRDRWLFVVTVVVLCPLRICVISNRYISWLICNTWSVTGPLPVTKDNLCPLPKRVFHIMFTTPSLPGLLSATRTGGDQFDPSSPPVGLVAFGRPVTMTRPIWTLRMTGLTGWSILSLAKCHFCVWNMALTEVVMSVARLCV
jgi:hypothetical protein